MIHAFARTVHHLEDFDDDRIDELERRLIVEADQLFVVSRMWREELGRRYDRQLIVVGNGVDPARFTNIADDSDGELRAKYLLADGKVFFAIGGVEERKNTVRILQAFVACRALDQSLTLVTVGGASLLDHSAYQRRFEALRATLQVKPGALSQRRTTGDQLPALVSVSIRRSRRCAMPEMDFWIRWPNSASETCYSPSLIINERPVPGQSFSLLCSVPSLCRSRRVGVDAGRCGFAHNPIPGHSLLWQPRGRRSHQGHFDG